MPIYHFTCPACGTKEQTEQSIHENIIHPKCQCGKIMEQQLFAPTITWGYER